MIVLRKLQWFPALSSSYTLYFDGSVLYRPANDPGTANDPQIGLRNDPWTGNDPKIVLSNLDYPDSLGLG